MFDFTDQVAIVTGGTRGIGRGVSEAFLKAGAKVIATFTSNEASANEFKDSLGELSKNLTLKKFDVSDYSAVESFWNEVKTEFAQIHVLVNNSGIRKDGLGMTMPVEDWKQVLSVNLDGSFYMSKMAIEHFMSNRYGRIVNMSSVGGRLALSGQANYAASKAAQVAMSKTLSKEVGKKGITINNVCPGFIETELIADLPAEQVKEYKKQVPLKRFGKVSEVAHGVLFLAAKESGYITGTSLDIAGGL
jgi:3-oxoacyl-[acyl-carrier protein] reductase